MAIRRAPANGKPKLPPLVEAELMLTAARMGMSGTDALTDAATRWIKWAKAHEPRERFKADKAAFDAGRSHTSPDPVRYGLPPDFGIPRHP